MIFHKYSKKLINGIVKCLLIINMVIFLCSCCFIRKQENKLYDYNVIKNYETNEYYIVNKNGDINYKSDADEVEIIRDYYTYESKLFHEYYYGAEPWGCYRDMNGKIIIYGAPYKLLVDNFLVLNDYNEKQYILDIENINEPVVVLKDIQLIDYIDDKFFLSYTDDYNTHTLKLCLYDRKMNLIKEIEGYNYDGKIKIGKNEYYKLKWCYNTIPYSYSTYNLMDKNLNILFDTTIESIEGKDSNRDIKYIREIRNAKNVKINTLYGSFIYDFDAKRIKEEKINEGFDKKDFIKYDASKVRSVNTYSDGYIMIAEDENRDIALDEKMKSVTNYYKNLNIIDWIGHGWKKVKKDNIIFQIIENDKRKYMYDNKIFCTLEKNDDIRLFNSLNKYYWLCGGDADKLFSIDKDEPVLVLKNKDIFDITAYKMIDKTYYLTSEVIGDGKNKYTLYNENADLINYSLTSNDIEIFDDKFVLYKNDGTVLCDKELNIVKDFNENYYKIDRYDYDNKTIYIASKYGSSYDIYDERFNLVYKNINYSDKGLLLKKGYIAIWDNVKNGIYDFNFNLIYPLDKYCGFDNIDIKNEAFVRLFKQNEDNFDIFSFKNNEFKKIIEGVKKIDINEDYNVIIVQLDNGKTELYDLGFNLINEYGGEYILIDINSKYSIIRSDKSILIDNKSGKILIDKFDILNDLTDNYCTYRNENEFGLCDYNGNVLLSYPLRGEK